jgi:hypothetical protein
MDALLKDARASVRAYLNGLLDDQVDAVTFVRLYANATEACVAAGLTLAQLRVELTKGAAR